MVIAKGSYAHIYVHNMSRHPSIPYRVSRASLGFIVILVALLALLPVKKLVTAEAGCMDNQIRAALDEVDSAALVDHVAGPPVPKEVIYLIPDAPVRFVESPVVSSHLLRGPPVLFSFPQSGLL